MENLIENLIALFGFEGSKNTSLLVSVSVISIATLIIYKFSGCIVAKAIRKIVTKTSTSIDDYILNEKFLKIVSKLIPAIFLTFAIKSLFFEYEKFLVIIERFLTAYITIIVVLAVTNFASSLEKIYRTYPISRIRPIKGYLQLLNIFIFIIGFIVATAVLLDKPAWGFISGIGAMSAILLLIFKDSILGLVASFQLSANNMVQIGDWIEMPKYGADGDVTDITLQTVKVLNFDRTVTTIPVYALVSDSFKNWRSMSELNGRRVMRSINIDATSVKFCSDEMIENFKKIKYLKDYIEQKEKVINEYNKKNSIDPDIEVNGRRMTNLGTFRAYVKSYIEKHPETRKDLIYIVRHLQPTTEGIPIQIYVFASTSNWVEYERIQADIFDHLFAVIPHFGLRVFQKPSGWNIEQIKNQEL